MPEAKRSAPHRTQADAGGAGDRAMTAPASGESSQAPTSDEGGRAAVMATAPASGASPEAVEKPAEATQAVEKPKDSLAAPVEATKMVDKPADVAVTSHTQEQGPEAVGKPEDMVAKPEDMAMEPKAVEKPAEATQAVDKPAEATQAVEKRKDSLTAPVEATKMVDTPADVAVTSHTQEQGPEVVDELTARGQPVAQKAPRVGGQWPIPHPSIDPPSPRLGSPSPFSGFRVYAPSIPPPLPLFRPFLDHHLIRLPLLAPLLFSSMGRWGSQSCVFASRASGAAGRWAVRLADGGRRAAGLVRGFAARRRLFGPLRGHRH